MLLKNMITILFKEVVFCTYPPVSFDIRTRCSLFVRIAHAVEEHDNYFIQRSGILHISSCEF
jgi:hypothetical protein